METAKIQKITVTNKNSGKKTTGIGFVTPYEPAFIREFKGKVNGYRWFPNLSAWFAPDDQSDKAMEIAKKYFEVEE